MEPESRFAGFTDEELEELGIAVAYYLTSGREVFSRLDSEIEAEVARRSSARSTDESAA